MNPSTFPPTALVKDLNAQTPEFANSIDFRKDLGLLYEGGNALKREASRFLRKRPKEIGSVTQARLNAVTYDNLLAAIVSWYTAKLFENPLQIDPKIPGTEALPTTETAFYDSFLSDCDNAGTPLEKFFEKITSDVLVFGKGYFLIDLPKLDIQPANYQEQVDLGALNPYFVYVDPNCVQNWQCDDFGGYEWVVLHTVSTQSSFLGKPETVEQWRYYDKQSFAIYETRYEDKKKPITANLIGSGRHALADENEVPLHCINADDRLWLGNRIILPLVEYFNQDNAFGWALWLANSPIPTFTDGKDGKVDTSQTVAEYSALVLPNGGEFKWSELEGKSFDSSQKRLDSLKDTMYRLCHLLPHAKSSKGSDYQSGVSREVMMQPASDVLNIIGSLVRSTIENALEDVADIRDDGVVIDVRGMNFAEDQAGELVSLALEIGALNIPSETFKQEVQKKVVRTFLRDANTTTVQECVDEIKSAPPTAIQPAEQSTVALDVTERGQVEE